MSFLNAALAFGAFAFTVPLIIHLFFRSRFRKVEWGAMHLLENVVRVNRRRMRLTNLLLLLLRCAIPVLLAFCLARPVITGFQSLAGDAPKTLVIALDDTRSMSATPPGGESRLERSKRELRGVLDDLTRKDEVILVRASRLGAVPATMGASEAAAALRKITATGGAVPVGDLLQAAHDAAASGTHARRQILLVSDFQSNAMAASTLETARQIAQSTDAESETLTRPAVDLLNVGGGSETLSNVSVDEVSVQSPVVVAERGAVYSAVLRNNSELPANDLRLVWSIDGEPLEPRVISVDAKSTKANRLTHTIDTPGMHEVSVSVDRGDALVDDNRRSLAVEVMQEINVVLIDGKPSKEPLGGQADYLAIALSPFAFGGDDRPDPVRAAVIPERQLGQTLKENEVRVVVLAGVGRLGNTAKRLLADFVSSGGALVTFDGPEMRSELFATPWSGEEEDVSITFPVSAGEIVGEPEARNENTSTFAIDEPAQLYQPWRLLSRGNENPLADVKVFAYRKWSLDSDSADEVEPPIVLLQTPTGDPLAVRQRAGEGTIVQFAISGDDSWSNLPLRPVFLPLIQQMVLDLAGKRGDTMIAVGEPIVIGEKDWPKLSEQAKKQTESKRLKTSFLAQTPLGETPLTPDEEDDTITLTATYTPGAYRFEKRFVNFDDPENAQSVATLRMASIPASESILMDAEESRLQSVAETLGATVFTQMDQLRAADQTRAYGREIWRWFLAALLIALVLELWLQQNLIARRRSAGVTS
ncbi:MAG: BatA domain-containing protein [Planctomycetota bacterium]